MAAAFRFELVSPEKLLLSDEIDEVIIPGSEGYMTVLERHAPVMTRLQAGIVRVKKAGQPDRAFVVFNGFADIAGKGCSVLAEQAIALKASDERELESSIEKAQAALQASLKGNAPLVMEDFVAALA